MSSGLTRFAFPGSAAYAACKGAVEVLTRYMGKELGTRGIAAKTVAPGAITTDFSGGIVRDDPKVNRKVIATIALGRAGVPDDVGAMIASLLSDASRWVNAQRVEVLGGTMIQDAADRRQTAPACVSGRKWSGPCPSAYLLTRL